MPSTPVQNTCAQISGTKFTLADGTASTSQPQPQPHLTPLPLPSPGKFHHILSSLSDTGIKDRLTLPAQSWIIDTGASCHVCFDLTLFHSTESISNTSVVLPDGTNLSVTISGTIRLTENLILHSVLYVPNFKFNLLSISALTYNNSISVLFSSDTCLIFPFNPFTFLLQERTPVFTIGKGSLHRNLYVLQSPEAHPLHQTSSNNVFQVSSEVWHQRLGHPSPSKLQTLSKLLAIPNGKTSLESICKVCPLAKQKGLSFSSFNNLSSSPFDLVYIDTWGPFHVKKKLRDINTFLLL